MKNRIIAIVLAVIAAFSISTLLIGCDVSTSTSASGAHQDKNNTISNANKLQSNQPTPTDIEYSLERYNLIRRAYWVNGQREKAMTVPCAIKRPLGYIILMSGNTVVGRFEVDGKVSSLNSYLTPDSEYYEQAVYGSYGSADENKWLADVDGSYGTNDNGIFFFTPDGKYIEWTGTYLYSDIPFIVENPVVNVAGGAANE